MTKENIFQKVVSIFEEVLNGLDLELLESTTAEDIDDWDSITHIEIISEIEDQFDIRVNMEDMENLNNVGDIIQLIASKLKK